MTLNEDSEQALGLVAWWPMLNADGPRLLRDRHRNHASTIGAGTPTYRAMGARFGLMRNYDGTFYDNITDTADLTQPGGFSYTVWAHTTFAADPEFAGKYTASGLEWVFASQASTLYAFVYDNTNATYRGRTYTYSASGLAVDAHHFGFSYDGGILSSGVKIYVDGIQVDGGDFDSGGTFASIVDTTALMQIGRAESWGATTFLGVMADARFYGRALTEANFRALVAPQTRWELYRQPSTRTWFQVGVAAPDRLPLPEVYQQAVNRAATY